MQRVNLELPDYRSDEDNDQEDTEDTDSFAWTQEQFDAFFDEGDTSESRKR